jgi:hypothetical protein
MIAGRQSWRWEVRAVAGLGIRRVRVTRRLLVRYLAAALSLATAAVYFAIGFGVVTVVDKVANDAPPMLVFGGSAGTAFVLGAALLFRMDRRALWILGAVLQVGVIVMYVNVAPNRTPSYEMWGLLIKVFQAAILAALVYLVFTPATPESA